MQNVDKAFITNNIGNDILSETTKKNILVLTPIYPADDLEKGETPVVHYFTKEWVKLGYNVLVMHYYINFPEFLYALLRPFKRKLSSIFGFTIQMTKVIERQYILDGVHVCRIPLLKYKPHARFNEKEINKAFDLTLANLKKNDFTPDVITAHWVNPCFDLMHRLKNVFSVPTCYIAHDAGLDLLGIYKKEAASFIQETDILGYRSKKIKNDFEKNFGCQEKRNFMCYSGIPKEYLCSDNLHSRTFKKIENFIFVGTLIKRKHPAEIIPALKMAMGNDNFKMMYIGVGAEDKKIRKNAQKYNCEKNNNLCGFMERKKVVDHLKQNDIFVMISENETFGLVYLEAMAVGCIVIASKNEGFDGIIEDGVNGFLCNAGDIKDLSSVIKRIKELPVEKLNEISLNAIATAKKLTDEKVASEYLNNILKMVEHESQLA